MGFGFFFDAGSAEGRDAASRSERFLPRPRPLFIAPLALAWAILCLLLVTENIVLADEARGVVSFGVSPARLDLLIDKKPVATYVAADPQIQRPYFCDLRTRSGIAVTRHHPPRPDQDLADHPTMHPGLWLAFGDLNSADFWRNRATVRHVRFLDPPANGTGRGTFTVLHAYEIEGTTIGTEECQITLTVEPDGYLIRWSSLFRASHGELRWGDQEEMGLGVRMATPLAVVRGGRILDSEGRRNGAEVWGKQATWCEYSGVIENQRVGIVLIPDPENFRRSWFHARDYGLLVANPFGVQAFTKAEPQPKIVPAGGELRLNFGVRVFAVPEGNAFDPEQAYRAYLKPSP